MQETWVWVLGQEDSLEKGMATHPSILAWSIPWTEVPGQLHSPCGRKELDTTEQLFFVHSSINEHLGCFLVLAIVDSAAMNTYCVYLFNLEFLPDPNKTLFNLTCQLLAVSLGKCMIFYKAQFLHL